MSRTRDLSKQISNLITISTGGSNFVTPQILSASIAGIQEDINNIDLSEYLTESSASITYATLNILNEKLGKATEIKSASTSYTLILEDLGKLIEINTSSANNLTIPLESSVNLPIGSQIYIIQTGTGQTTIVPTVGVSLSGTPGLKLRSQNSGAQLIKRSSNNWVAIGDLVS
jgi:hypothetical protein